MPRITALPTGEPFPPLSRKYLRARKRASAPVACRCLPPPTAPPSSEDPAGLWLTLVLSVLVTVTWQLLVTPPFSKDLSVGLVLSHLSASIPRQNGSVQKCWPLHMDQTDILELGATETSTTSKSQMSVSTPGSLPRPPFYTNPSLSPPTPHPPAFFMTTHPAGDFLYVRSHSSERP